MDSQFNVYLNGQPIIFSKNKKDLNTNKILTFKEFHNLELIFKSSVDDISLEIPSLMDYPIKKINQLDFNDEIKIYPNDTPIYLYESENQRVPILPGIYVIIVNYQKNKFFGQFKIDLKDLSENDWERMIDDIENTSIGLAQSSNKSGKYKPFDENRNFIIREASREKLIYYCNKIEYLANQIEKHPKFKIQKKYDWINKGKEKFIDGKTLKHYSNMSTKVLAPSRISNYNIPPNQFIKNVFNKLLRISISTKLDLEKINKQIKNEKNSSLRSRKIKISISKISGLIFALYNIINGPIFGKVNTTQEKNIPRSVILNQRYNGLYKILNEINNPKDKLDPDVPFKYYWKDTAKLYEIWVFIKTLKALNESGYKPSRWIFDNDKNNELHQGTLVRFDSLKDNIYLNVVYDEELKATEKELNLTHPLKTDKFNKRRPDIRIDIFKKSTNNYLGSIILDAKYMKLHKISNKDRVHKQLHSYANDPKNPDLLKIDHRIRPIANVDAIAASGEESKKINKDEFEETTFSFLILNPSTGFNQFKKKITSQIDAQVSYIIKERHIYD
ncbi:nuclease domain-containing protein [Fructilactobacillus carniphilus]|uniref:DUF2357 domain-containing protein n=1 Tax=Fructilactobacillus carniphilus TaxID=2940297 RepID=A0ABY5BXU0_9LACO|nr:nuclease domain-containing protein [Fructilactobacillus carniphilus]USS91325.1 hypothetical protein M3M37_03790 [Fructilactobacillus carniphilus]